MSNGNTVATVDVVFENLTSLDADFGSVYVVSDNHILYASTETWNSQPELVAKEGWLYIYSDYHKDIQNNNVASIKVGDGTTLLSEVPFVDKLLYLHTADEIIHITQAEREKWNKSANAIHFLGVTTTALTDGASTNPIVINNTEVAVENGDMASYQSKEFVFSDDAGSVWQEFGDLSGLGTLAYKNSIAVETLVPKTFTTTFIGNEMSINTGFTPSGSVSAPTISVNQAGTTTKIKGITNVGTLPSATMPTIVEDAEDSELLVVTSGSFNAGTLPTMSEEKTVKTGDASYTASAPTFTGETNSQIVKVRPTGNCTTIVASTEAVDGTVTYEP